MTPERKEYLMEHTGREATIRDLIRGYKHELKKCKAVCSSYDLKRIGRKPFGYRIHIVQVNETKLIINALRHELQCLKGMDRVVVPRDLTVNKKIVGMYFCNVAYGVCVCGEHLVSIEHNFCPKCGRKILWEKVK